MSSSFRPHCDHHVDHIGRWVTRWTATQSANSCQAATTMWCFVSKRTSILSRYIALYDAIENSADFWWSLINQHFIQLSIIALTLQFCCFFAFVTTFANPGEQSSFDNKARVLYAPAWHRQGPHQSQHHHHHHHHHPRHHHHHHHHQQDYTAITAVVVVLGLFSFSCISLTLFRVYRFKVIFS